MKCDALIEADVPTLFSFDEAAYSIDLCTDCKMRARDETTLVELIKMARPEYVQVGPHVRRLIRGKSGDISTKTIRAWGKDAGLAVGKAGVLRKEVVDAFHQAHA